MTITSKQLIDNWTDYEVVESWFLSPISPISYVLILKDKRGATEDGNHILLRMTEGEEDLTVLHIGELFECYAMAKRAYGLENANEDTPVLWTTTAANIPQHPLFQKK